MDKFNNFIKTAIVILAIAFICGCKPATDSRIDQMQAQIITLQSNITDLLQRNENRKEGISNCFVIEKRSLAVMQTLSTNLSELELRTTIMEDGFSLQEAEILHVETVLTNLAVTMSGRPRILNAQSALSIQIPASVAAQIRADAERHFPNDYDEQNYIINEQTEAWHKLNP